MTHYSYSQLEGLWINAGGSKSLAPVMAAIAEAESGGNSDAYNSSGASGLWQILGAVNPADQGNLFSPQTNAKEAVLKYKSQGLTAWTTYVSGAYKAYLSNSTTPSGVSAGQGTSSAAASSASAGCIIGIPPLSFSALVVHLSTPNVCFFSKSNARALIGGLIVGVGISALGIGLAVIVVSAFGKHGKTVDKLAALAPDVKNRQEVTAEAGGGAAAGETAGASELSAADLAVAA